MGDRVRPRLALVARAASAVYAAAFVVAVVSACLRPRAYAPEPSFASGPGATAPVDTPTSEPPPTAPRGVQVGYATWYGRRFAGRRTANGERFDPGKMTAAHRTLAFGTWVEVKRLDTGRSVRVRITDRGPFGHDDRIIDLSRAAAQRLDLLKDGLTRVEISEVPGP
jgi:rare lipoprotein A